MTEIDLEAPPAIEPAAPVRRTRTRRVPGEEGTWIFIFGDMVVFAVFFCVFLQTRISDPTGFARDQAELNQNFGAVNTVLLLVSSLFIVLTMRVIRSPNLALRAKAPLFLAAAWLCGLSFLVIKVFEYTEKVQHGVTPQTSDFFMYYFVLTGLHAFHLVLGLAVLVALFVMSRKPELTKGQFGFFEGGACFWHMVDLLWLVLFPLIFLVR